MSAQGIEIAAKAFQTLQQLRGELLELGSAPGAVGTPSGNQDIRLGQLLDDMKDAGKDRFAKITVEDVSA